MSAETRAGFSTNGRRILCGMLLLAWFCTNPSPLRAHPHIFIVQRLKAVFDAEGLAGIAVRWKFDDMFSAMIAEDHDRNKNARLEPDEVKTIEKMAFSYISEYGYFIHITIDNRPFRVKFIKNFKAILEKDRLVYEFFAPCHVRATQNVKKIKVSTYDPTYYSAIFFGKYNPVSLAHAEPFQVKTAIREDLDTSIYFGMIHPWTLFVEFRLKQG